VALRWTAANVPDQRGRVALITGANSGIGFEAAAVLADKGAHVVLGVRDLAKGQQSAARITDRYPQADVAVQHLDLASLGSVHAAVKDLKAAHPQIDLLINNAGVAMTPKGTTRDGFDLQFGTNHLGPFALTGLLLECLLPVEGSRVVTISSQGHRARATIDFDDLHAERRYDRAAAYTRSKLANLPFTYELQRTGVARSCHDPSGRAPRGSRTGLMRNAPRGIRAGVALLSPLIFQSAAMGALPTLRAATDPTVRGGQYYGPGGFAEQRGYPKCVQSSAQIARPGSAAPVVGGFRGAHRRDLPGVTKKYESEKRPTNTV
jgi:NAD(P)-dependent dehydrogenase (short-subunit alcohol dehydrogenase family)